MSQIPDIYLDDNHGNPSIMSPNAPYAIFFAQTADILLTDHELFKRFIDNVISQFRHSRVYKNYKSYLHELGFDRCQMFGNITTEMATIEMHHNTITIFDLAVIIATHLMKTGQSITTMDVFNHLRLAHIKNKVPIVMLCKTAHQLEHNEDDFYEPIQMTLGNWGEFLSEYHYGITYGIGRKIIRWINKSLDEQIDKGTLNEKYIKLRDQIIDWSVMNDAVGANNTGYLNGVYPFNSGFRNSYGYY